MSLEVSGFHQLPLPSTHSCFACGPRNERGLRLAHYTDGWVNATWFDVPPHMTGWGQLIHGGLTSLLLDEVTGITPLAFLQKFVLTRNLHIEFIKPISVGSRICISAQLSEPQALDEIVVAGAIEDEAGTVRAMATARFRAVSDAALGKFAGYNTEDLERFRSAMQACQRLIANLRQESPKDERSRDVRQRRIT
jgi:acyl-coenzyme A thioesterase PaaI-like protein